MVIPWMNHASPIVVVTCFNLPLGEFTQGEIQIYRLRDEYLMKHGKHGIKIIMHGNALDINSGIQRVHSFFQFLVTLDAFG